MELIEYTDHRGLTAAFVAPGNRIVLPDERAPGDYATESRLLKGFDVELTIYETTGWGGAVLPKYDIGRRTYRDRVIQAIWNDIDIRLV